MTSDLAGALQRLQCEVTDVDRISREAFLGRLAGLASEEEVEALAAAAGSAVLSDTYRIMNLAQAQQADGWIGDAFTAVADQYVPFARDWLGRIFALDRARTGGGPLVTLLDVGAAEMLDTPVTLEGLHRTELVDFADDALAMDLFEEWQAEGGAAPAADQCVGYRTPLFLGGEDAVSNLELIDMDVYWTITAQIIAGIGDARSAAER